MAYATVLGRPLCSVLRRFQATSSCPERRKHGMQPTVELHSVSDGKPNPHFGFYGSCIVRASCPVISAASAANDDINASPVTLVVGAENREYFAPEVVMAQACDLTGSLPNRLCQTPLMNPGRRLASLHISQAAHPSCNQVPFPTVGAVAMKRGDHQQNAAESNEGVATLKIRTLIVADIRNETRQLGIKYPKRICRRLDAPPLVAKYRNAGGRVVASLKKSRYGLCSTR